MPEPSQDPDGHDTSLARALHAQNAAPVEVLQASLAEARRRRALGRSSEESSLARVISERALVEPTVLAEAARSVSGEHLPPLAGSATGTHAGLLSSSDEGRVRDQLALPPQLGPFRLRRELARGGMGAVWEVEHIESGQVFALKTILRRDGPAGDALLRFRREAELGARLDHPHVVRVHSAHLEGDTPWLVQTYLPGGSLEERLKRTGPLPIDEAVAVVAKVARGLAHAHARGVLHRDLKPANVLFDAEGEPRLVDFGVARSLREGTMRLTATGEVLGSPAYMAPEQALGEKEVDARADVHALGSLLYALLTGGPPFDGKLTLEVIEQVISRPATPPSARRPGVPPAVDAVVLRCLQKEPAARYQTADEVAAALEVGPAADAPPPRRGPLLALGATAGLAVLLAAVALAVGRRPGPGPAPAGATEPGPSPAAPVVVAPRGALPDGWTATFEANPVFGLAWTDLLDDTPGGLSLTFERTAPLVVEGDVLVLRLQVTRLAYAASLGDRDGGFGAALNDMRYDSAVEGAHDLRKTGGPMRKALRHVNDAACARVTVRLDRRTGEVRTFEGFPSPPVVTSDELEAESMTAALCDRLAAFLSNEAVGGYLDTALRVLPATPPAGTTWRLESAFVPQSQVRLRLPRVYRSAGPGLFEVAADVGVEPKWEARSGNPQEKVPPKRMLTIAGRLRVEGPLVLESEVEVGVESYDADPFNGEKSAWRARRWAIRWAPGPAPAPPKPERR